MAIINYQSIGFCTGREEFAAFNAENIHNKIIGAPLTNVTNTQKRSRNFLI